MNNILQQLQTDLAALTSETKRIKAKIDMCEDNHRRLTSAIESDMRRAKHALTLCQETEAMLSERVSDAIKVGS